MRSDRRTPNRISPTILQRINPLWWLDDAKRNPRWPRWKWFLRNPAINFCAVIIGISDEFRTVYYSGSPWTFSPLGGWNYGYSVADTGVIPRPFISYRGSLVEWSIGWKTSGRFGLTLRRSLSPNAEDMV